jgi:hypothetical protein
MPNLKVPQYPDKDGHLRCMNCTEILAGNRKWYCNLSCQRAWTLR